MQGMDTVIPQDRIKYNEEMKNYTTFRIGGKADCLITPENEKEFVDTINYLREKQQKYYIIGNGSNLLVDDEGYHGCVIRLKEWKDSLQFDEEKSGMSVTAAAGVRLSKIAMRLAEYSMTGFEFAAGIPGTLGGAIVMNAGAYGGEMKDCVKNIRILDLEGNIREISGEEAEFSYRTSGIMQRGELVLGARMYFEKGNKASILERIEELSGRRKEKQPLEYPSAGSTFKRPEGYFAGKLIMDAGMRGYRIGDAAVSDKHCGFVVNLGAATSADVLKVMDDVAKKVYEQFGVELEPEIKYLK